MVLLSCVSLVSAAIIHGTVYDISLNKMENVRVEVNTEPKQQYIAKNGTYFFEVHVGDYIIQAEHYVSNLLESSAVENISVKSDGTFVLDLILLPILDSELLKETEGISVEGDEYLKEQPNYWIIVFAVIVLILILLFVYIIKKPKIPKKESGDYLDKILELIKKEGRITQKEIRKQIPLSEAKISLIISELEAKGIVRKIKRGRGNIIILEKK